MNKNKKQNHPNFYAVIPSYVRYHRNLNSFTKLLYGEISALCSKEGYCWASNSFFAEVYNVSISKISRSISELEKNSFLSVTINKEGGNSRHIHLVDLNATYSQHSPYLYADLPIGIGENDMSTLINNKESIIENPSPLQTKNKPKVCKKIKFRDFVRLTQEEYGKLVDMLGKKDTEYMIERLDDYIGSKGVKYVSHYRTILNWVKKDKPAPSRGYESLPEDREL